MNDTGEKVRLRNLADDLKERIKRGEANEAKLAAKVETLRAAGEALRAQKAELVMLREMLKMSEGKPVPLPKKVPANGVDPDAEFE